MSRFYLAIAISVGCSSLGMSIFISAKVIARALVGRCI